MKILLAAVNAKYIHSNLAVYSLKAFAGEYKEQIEIGEYTINQKKDEILKGLYQKRPDVLCFSCYIWNISYVTDLITEAAKLMPHTRIWVGGPEVSYDGEAFLNKYPQVEGVMVGEGEETFLELVRHYTEGRTSLEQIPGIVFRDRGKGQLCRTSPREILDMSMIPFPYEKIEAFNHKIIYYESSRGCPFSCSYCLSSVDKRLRFRKLDLVYRELQYFLDHRVPQVKFVDRTFNCRRDHAMGIWTYIRDHDNGVTNFHFEIAADLLTREELELMRTLRPGLIQLEIGVQSTNERTIEAIRRKMDFARVSEVVSEVHRGKNIHQHLDLIAGLPFEDYKSFGRSFDQVYRLKPNQLQLGFLKVLKGSYMHENAGEYGCVYQSREPYEVLRTKWLSYDDVLRLKGIEEMVEIYYNSGQFSTVLTEIEATASSPFMFYETLAAFYEERGYFSVSHARLRRYDILLEFLMEWDRAHLEEYKERMLYDLYLRENLKSRPGWAKDMGSYRNKIHAFYQREEETPRYLTEYKGYQARQLCKMTHIEVFSFPADAGGEKEERWILFDYKTRDPLTNDALAIEIPPRELEE